MARSISTRPEGYEEFLRDVKQRIRTAQVRAALAVNRELVLLYWSIGRDIIERQGRQGWGAKIIEKLSADLRGSFPDMPGFSPRNRKYMRAFAEAWPDRSIVQQVVAQIPWGHNVRILDQVKDPTQREWYARAAFEHGWSRNVLVFRSSRVCTGGRGKRRRTSRRHFPRRNPISPSRF
jgi:predicted nuclease of restriction endonuclease-like (RecB) superfamily